MRNTLLLVAFFTALVLTTGCGDGKLATIVVTGTVTYDGSPLDGASITFSPKGDGHAAFGVTDTNGRYTLQTILGSPDAGTTPGDYAVQIEKFEVLPPLSEEELARGVQPPSPKRLIPERYADYATSGLAATVKKGEKNEFNFDLMK